MLNKLNKLTKSVIQSMLLAAESVSDDQIDLIRSFAEKYRGHG